MSSIKVIKSSPLATFTKARTTDVGYDLTVVELSRELLSWGRLYRAHLGVQVEPPAGYFFQLVPRSSFSKLPFSVANSFGIVDPTYRGEWIVPLLAHFDIAYGMSPEEYLIGKRLFQAVLTKFEPTLEVKYVETLSETERGTGGFGSTGEKEFKV